MNMAAYLKARQQTIDRALDMIASGEIIDGKTIMLLQHAALHLFR